MNKENIINLINELIVSRNQIQNQADVLNNVTTNLQNTTTSDIVFYNVNANEKSKELFLSRLKSAKPGLLIVNFEANYTKAENVVFIAKENFLRAQKIILDRLFSNKNKLKLVGVTGTNGKTTTVNLAMEISNLLGHKAFSVGTIGIYDQSGAIHPELEATSPSYVEFRKLINKFQDTYEACFVEVSSHALHQSRFYDLTFHTAAWTSFSQDHLDYHKTMDEYLDAKMLLEKNHLEDQSSVFVPKSEKSLLELILKRNPNAKIKIAHTLEERKIASLPLFYRSKFNKSNLELALELVDFLYGRDLEKLADYSKIPTPKGRFSVIELGSEKLAIVDYAHTPDALLNVGEAIKDAFVGYKLTVVFGCGGNRDKTKRPLMGKAVASFANKIIVTSDNPRDEAPEDIIIDIISGIASSYEAQIDRKKAIEHAIESMENKEIVLIAGKGHEEYQEIKGIKHPFSDFEIVNNFSKRSK